MISSLALLLLQGASTLPQPHWPSTFVADYVSDDKHTTGYYASDTSPGVGASRITFEDGSGDHLCSYYHTKTPCEQLTTGGFRYLYFPNLPDCCKCCTYATGSYLCGGPVGPRWMSNATGNLIYEGKEVILGRACHKWGIQGIFPTHMNYYFQDVETGLPCGLDGYNYLRTPDEPADDQYLFKVGSVNLTVPHSTFDVPQLCKAARYCGGKVCAAGPDVRQFV
ncbi:unnamed protein product [Symbiodinium natans]|uniref:Uncharacterized protein n=1 Tax=Symbiodinium natans TaxID=878477 RepID=A0A812UXW8_9DINO|nr:unnamed protein product [Symbiodinium natans]